MEILHQLIIEAMSGGFWNFIGYFMLLTLIIGTPAKVIIFAINRPLRHRNISKHGYPPAHCDADGDFKKPKEKEDTDSGDLI